MRSLILPLPLLLLLLATTNATSPPTAKAPCGTVTGAWESLTNGLTNKTGTIASFRGIKYATADRWQPPTTTPTCEGTATDDGPQCYQGAQLPSASPSSTSTSREQSEDCLLLNVFTPKPSSGSSLLPVVVWIHGGSLVFGSSTFYGAVETFALDGVVLVSIQYRLGMLGFGALPSLAQADPRGTSGNYGFLDQQAALQWVQTNIEAFGGDRTRVTLLGQSSGGTSIFALMASPASKGLFSGAISLSGSPNMTMSLEQANVQNEQLWLARTSCKNASDVLACLRALPAKDAVNTPLEYYALSSFPSDPTGIHWAGMAIVDGHTVPLPIQVAYREGMIDATFVVQNLQGENDMSPNSTVDAFSSAQMKAFFEKNFEKFPNANGSQAGDQLYEHIYASEAAVHPSYAYYATSADTALSCGSVFLAASAAQGLSSPVYTSVVTASPGKPIQRLFGGEVMFPAHGWDFIAAAGLWPLIQEFYTAKPYTPTTEDILFGLMVRNQWLDLFRNGDFTSASHGWSTVDASSGFPHTTTTGLITRTSTTSVPNLKTDICDFYASLDIDTRFWWVN